MTPLFNRIDYASDAAFLLWFAVGMAAIGVVIGAYMAGRWVWRRVEKARREYRERKAYRMRIARIVRRLKDADMGRG